MTVPERPTTGAQHLDPGSWGRLIDSLDIASILVVIGTWMGPRTRGLVGVEDIWQETLWLAWRDREQHAWSNLAAFRAWLLGIARHRIADACRSMARQKRGGGSPAAMFTDMASQDSVSRNLPPASTTPSRILGHRERAQAMASALEAMPPPLRAVVHLRLFEELSMREVAEQLGIPLSTAKERLVRGVVRYRELLAVRLRGESAPGAGEQ